MADRRVLARHPLAIIGALLTTTSAVLFIALVIAVLARWLSNPYAGLVVFIAIPAAFIVGLLLIPLGMWLEQRRLRKNQNAISDWPVVDFRNASVRRTTLVITALTAVNIVVVLLAGYGTLHWMESPTFCGRHCQEVCGLL